MGKGFDSPSASPPSVASRSARKRRKVVLPAPGRPGSRARCAASAGRSSGRGDAQPLPHAISSSSGAAPPPASCAPAFPLGGLVAAFSGPSPAQAERPWRSLSGSGGVEVNQVWRYHRVARASLVACAGHHRPRDKQAPNVRVKIGFPRRSSFYSFSKALTTPEIFCDPLRGNSFTTNGLRHTDSEVRGQRDQSPEGMGTPPTETPCPSA